jgi:hypothetical protein
MIRCAGQSLREALSSTSEYTESAFSHHFGILDGILLNHFQSCICGNHLYNSPIQAQKVRSCEELYDKCRARSNLTGGTDGISA